nr:MAG: capsid protein [Chemarfal virus 26]
MENRIVVLQRVLAQLEQDVDFITKYIHIVQEDTLHISYKPQSADATVAVHETVDFIDAEAGDVAGLASTDTAFVGDDMVDEADLANFLSRPVRIATTTWLESDSSTVTKLSISPWQLFFNDPRIKRKLDNFAFLRANLKIKVMVNASPFYHGYALCSYQPLPNFTPSTLGVTVLTASRVQLSQRPHIWINPQDNQAGEMTLPFLWPKNWLSIRSSQEFADMGELNVKAFTELYSANGVTGTGVSIQIYAWAEDVKLSGSTLSLAMQARDEYGSGPISGPASALAKVAASLEPTFGRFATATKMVANTTADVAKLFGFTNVPVIEEAKPMRISQFANFASPEIGYPVNKLTLDAKNELSIDPTILGLPNQDELSVANIATRQSYYYQFNWTTSQVVDTVLAYQNVTPMCVDTFAATGYTTYVYTPMAYVAGLFQAWRGDIKVTFRFAATQYHKGRVRITYDPQGDATNNVTTVADGTSGAYTVFADLSDSAEVSMVIPYQQALPYLTTSATTIPSACYSTSSTPTFNMNAALHNGAFCVRVATALSAPVASSIVPVLVFVEGCDNLEFANPATIDPRMSPFIPQSSDTVLGAEIVPLETKRGLMNYGETVRSLRVLMRRATPTMPFVYPDDSTAGLRRFETVNRKIPPYPGFDPGAIYSGVGKINTAANFPYTWAAMSAMQYVNLAFIGYRGSTIWHYAPSVSYTTTTRPNLRAVRVNNSNSPLSCTTYVAPLSATNENTNALATLQEYGQTGMVITPIDVAAGTGVVVPNQARYLFQSTNPANATAGGTQDDSQYDAILTTIDVPSNYAATPSTSNVNYTSAYCGAGTDFTCIFFINTPALYKTTTVIPA